MTISSRSYVALFLLSCAVLASAEPAKLPTPTTWTLNLFSGAAYNGAKFVLEGSFTDKQADNFTVFDFTSLEATQGKKLVPLDDMVKSYNLVVKGPFKGLVSLKLYSDSCSNASADTVVFSASKNKDVLPATISGMVSALAVVMDNEEYDWGCYVIQDTSVLVPTPNGGVIDCLKTPGHIQCNTPQVCCHDTAANTIDYWQGLKCPQGLKKVPCDRRLRRFHRLNRRALV